MLFINSCQKMDSNKVHFFMTIYSNERCTSGRPFVIDIQNLCVQTLETEIWENFEYLDDKEIDKIFYPVLFIDKNGYGILVNSSSEDFEQFVKFVGDSVQREGNANVFHLEVIHNIAKLFNDTVTGQRMIRSWNDYLKDTSLHLSDITRMFESQIDQNDVEQFHSKQSHEFTTVFKSFVPPKETKNRSILSSYENVPKIPKTGSLNVKRITEKELMQSLVSGDHVILPMNNNTLVELKFSEIPVPGNNFLVWQEQKDGQYKCDEMKIPVSIGEQSIIYRSAGNTNLLGTFDELFNQVTDTIIKENNEKEKEHSQKCEAGTTQSKDMPEPCNADLMSSGLNSNLAGIHDVSDSDSSVSLSFDENCVEMHDEKDREDFKSVLLPACFSSKMDVNSRGGVRVYVKRRNVSNSEATSNLKTTVNEDENQGNIRKKESHCDTDRNCKNQTVDIVPEKVFEVTSNILKSLINTLEAQTSETSKAAKNIITAITNECSSSKGPISTPLTDIGEQLDSVINGQKPSSEVRESNDGDCNGNVASITNFDGKLQLLREMGFENSDYNIFLLKRYPNSLERVIESLLNYSEQID